MNIIKTALEGLCIVEPDVFGDNRGFFMETWQARRYADHGIKADFVQDNLSFSCEGTLRGLHFQYENTQAKLVQVIRGEVYDVAVDVRLGSPTFGRSCGVHLSGENKRQFFVPEGFAHGFCVLSREALFSYKCSDYYAPESEGGILWSDPDLGIQWPVKMPLLSDKDRVYPRLRDYPEDRLPVFRPED